MVNYSRVFGSQFPSVLITPGTHKDVDDSVIHLVNQYNSYIETDNVAAAYNLYKSNENILKPYLIDMAYINYLEEEVYNTGLLALSQYQVIQSDKEPPSDLDNGTYWVQEYE
ncbi:MAG: hypothetical protein J6C33_05540 [Lachnospiraceae bacterium]|nr:hypothetical protein [Lachnospiraceae bacterium]